MLITKFKHYLDLRGGERIICGIRPDMNIVDIDASEFGHFAAERSNRYDPSDYRDMRVTFSTDEQDFDGYIEVEPYDCLVGNYTLDQDYIDIIHEPLPNLKLVNVSVSKTLVTFCVVAFGSGDEMTEWSFIRFKELPAHVRIKVDVDAGFGYNAESYLIINRKTAEATEDDYVIEKYENGVLKRISEFGKDDNGEYELITIIV